MAIGDSITVGYSPSTFSLGCGFTRTDDSVSTTPDQTCTAGTLTIDGKYNIYFRRRLRETKQYEDVGGNAGVGGYRLYTAANKAAYLTGAGASTANIDMIEFVMCTNTAAAVAESTLTGVIDKESVPIVADGANGSGGHTVNNSTIYKGHTAIYTLPATTDVSNITDGLSGNNSGIIEIKDAWAVIDQDLVNTYNPGILFDSESFGNVCSLCMSNYKSAQITANINGGFVSLLYFKGVTLERKFRFNGTKLIFYYTAPNRWDTENIIITYYKWNNNAYEVVQTDNIKLNVSYTEILKHEYTIYTGDYDYCTIRFKSAVCIESVYVE